MSDGPYKACGTSKTDSPAMYGVSGPGDGLGYHAWYLYPENAFFSAAEAEKVARMMNIAFREGQRNRSEVLLNLLQGGS